MGAANPGGNLHHNTLRTSIVAGQIPTKGPAGPKTVTPKKTTPRKAPAKTVPGKAVAKVTAKKVVDKGDFTPAKAKAHTAKIIKGLSDGFDLIVAAHKGRIWLAYGEQYKSWDEYLDGEFGSVALVIPREKKKETVLKLADTGMSTRAIASATDIPQSTVDRTVREGQQAPKPTPAPDPNGSPPAIDADEVPLPDAPEAEGRTVTGLDGKSYPVAPSAPKAPTVINIVSVARNVAKELDKVRQQLDDLFGLDTYEANQVEVQGTLEQSVSDIIDTLLEEFGDMIKERLPEAEPVV